MRLLLSGEGPTDLGVCNNALGRCDGADFKHGAMTKLIIQLLEPLLGYSLADFPDSFAYVSETALCEETKATPRRLQPTRGKKKGAGTQRGLAIKQCSKRLTWWGYFKRSRQKHISA
ncbi:MAG: hypothetical protein KGL90_14085 [Burkholderiales bacterium]|nr:hypothetical protein [Burkholderiales bacterium]